MVLFDFLFPCNVLKCNSMVGPRFLLYFYFELSRVAYSHVVKEMGSVFWKLTLGAGKMSWVLRVLTSLPGDPSLVLSTHALLVTPPISSSWDF